MTEAMRADGAGNSQHSFARGVRLFVVCLAALTVSLPIAWISLAKFLLFVVGLVFLLANHWTGRRDTALHQLWTTRVLLVSMLVWAASLLWSQTDSEHALYSYVKHAKLMGIVLMVSLIYTAREARTVTRYFAFGSAFLLISSWLLFVGIPIPWDAHAATKYVVFSTYLDQSIMFAAAAAVFWHLRDEGLWPRWPAVVLAVLALVNVLLLLDGRTGYVVALTVLSMALMWAMPKRLRLLTLIVTPIVLLGGLTLGSSKVQERVSVAMQEARDYAVVSRVGVDTSIGWRLNAWHRSLQAIQENPLMGTGVGAWTITIKRIEGKAANALFGEGNHSNPHQELLLWGVELGLGGALLFIGIFVCLVRDAMRFPRSIQYATLSVVASMALACMFNSTLYDDWIGDFFCITLGLLFALGVRSQQDVGRAPA